VVQSAHPGRVAPRNEKSLSSQLAEEARWLAFVKRSPSERSLPSRGAPPPVRPKRPGTPASARAGKDPREHRAATIPEAPGAVNAPRPLSLTTCVRHAITVQEAVACIRAGRGRRLHGPPP
jgi:hypothetical protein